MYYDKQGKQISINEWENLIIDPNYKIIKQNVVDGFLVSTVWLGIDHAFFPGTLKPIIFETMIFGDKNEELDVKRASTIEEALEDHKSMLKRIKNRSKRIIKATKEAVNKEMKKIKSKVR